MTTPWKGLFHTEDLNYTPSKEVYDISLLAGQIYTLVHVLWGFLGITSVLLTTTVVVSTLLVNVIGSEADETKINKILLIYFIGLIVCEGILGSSWSMLFLMLILVPLLVLIAATPLDRWMGLGGLSMISILLLIKGSNVSYNHPLQAFPALLALLVAYLGFVVIIKQFRRNYAIKQNSFKNLIRSACHDISNPLTLILGCSQIAATGTYDGNPEKQLELWRKVERSSEVINRVLHSLRGFEAIHPPHFLRIDAYRMKDLIVGCHASLIDFAQSSGVKVDLDDIDSQGIGFVDRHLCQQVVLGNVLYNAIRFSPPQGTITISGHTKGRFFVISISDEGKGIPPNTLSKMFDFDFVSKSEAARGEKSGGFCLSVTKLVVEAFGGSLSIRSTTQGTVVQIQVPNTNLRL